jgi:iron complex transport system substrate-binding protein
MDWPVNSTIMQQLTYFLTVIFLFSGCTNPGEKSHRESGSNQYAHGFQIEKKENHQKLTVLNPWEKAKNISVEYYLLKKGNPLPDSLSKKKIIRTPVKRIICLSTTHLAFIGALNKTGTVVGVSGSQYVSNSKIRRRIKNNKVPDVGHGQNLNYEQIVNQKPDLVFVYGVGSEITSTTQKLNELGIPSVMVAEYLEEKPLGKAEWIKFVGAFFEKEKEASAYFSEVEKEYLYLKNQVDSQPESPKVMVGSPYKDTWWVPGGNSYMANLISDAGGDYLGKKNPANESFVISFENALAWGSQADVWINIGNLASKNEIMAADERFKNFRVFNEGRIFNNIKRLSPHGGNDFWESGTVRPHLLLKDLMTIFYPGMMNDELIYYKEIK